MHKESKLELIELPNQITVPTLGGKFFCSQRDPLKEAQSWFQRIELSLSGQEEILVLGLGAGFHLLPLLNLNKKIYVFEVHEELKQAWPKKDSLQFVDLNFETEALVLEFRPAWIGNESLYLEASRKFRGAEASALKAQAEKRDLWILAEALETSKWPGNLEISIKEIVELIPKENQSEEARVWRALRELVA